MGCDKTVRYTLLMMSATPTPVFDCEIHVVCGLIPYYFFYFPASSRWTNLCCYRSGQVYNTQTYPTLASFKQLHVHAVYVGTLQDSICSDLFEKKLSFSNLATMVCQDSTNIYK